MHSKKNHIYPISLPLPFSLKQITAYIVKSNDLLTIIDTGLHTEDTMNAWLQFFQKNNWSWHQVEKIIITHYHPDHYGLAGVLQQWSGAPVFIAKKEYLQIQALWKKDDGDPTVIASFFAQYGFPKQRLYEITKHMEGFRLVMEPQPQILEWLVPERNIQIGEEVYHIIETPGHSDGHVSFYQENEGTFFAGDVILPHITPNIPLLPNGDTNPLATFFTTLDRINDLEIKQVYPAHGDSFTDVKNRIEQIKEHHVRRLNKIVRIMKGQQQMTGFEMCEQLFGHKHLDVHNLRFAFSETLSHLEYLQKCNVIRSSIQDDIVIYSYHQ